MGRGRDTIGQYCPITRKAVCAAATMANPALSSSKSINHQPTTGKGIESSPNWKRGGFWIYTLLEMKEYNDLKPSGSAVSVCF